MSANDWNELSQLAERHCPQVLLDLPLLTESDALGVLRWLRRKADHALA